MRTYDHLFFDLDNTLWNFTDNSRLAMYKTLEQNGILSQLESFDSFFPEYELINKSLWSDYHSKKITKQTLIVERFSRSLQQFGLTDLDWKEINRSYLKSMALQTELFPGTIETLRALKAKGYQMHIITNGFIEVQHDKLRNCGLDEFFNKVFISEEVKTTKPHHQIFEHALKSTNARKRKSIMIGDSWETDINGALEFGMDQIMFVNHGLHELPEPINSLRMSSNTSFLELKPRHKTYFIEKIADLLVIL
jgi:putative hydrolase of the HAD superfamily